MFEQHPEISSDIEWILLSRQANQEMLLETLVKDHGSQIYQFAFAALLDQELAETSTKQICLRAVKNTRIFDPEQGAEKWLIKVAVPILQKNARKTIPDVSVFSNSDEILMSTLANLNWKSRLGLYLFYKDNFTHNEISSTLKVRPNWVNQQIEILQDALNHNGLTDPSVEEFISQSATLWDYHELEESELNSWLEACRTNTLKKQQAPLASIHLKESLAISAVILFMLLGGYLFSLWIPDTEQDKVAQAKAPLDSPQTLRQIAEPIEYTILPGESLADIAQRLNVSIDHLLTLNQLTADAQLTAGDKILVSLGRINSTQSPSSRQNGKIGELKAFSGESQISQDISANTTPQPNLDQQSSVDEIIARWKISQDLWQTLFLEGQWVDYGPVNMIGAARTQRFQVWIKQPAFSLIKMGPLDSVPNVTHLITSEIHLISETGQPKQLAWWQPDALPVIADSPLRTILSPQLFSLSLDPQNIEITGEGKAGSRPTLTIEALAVDHSRFYRMEVDAHTGILLRLQVFTPELNTLLAELVVTQMHLDPEFDDDNLFDPLRIENGQFTNDFHYPFPEGAQISSEIDPEFEIKSIQTEDFSPAPEGFNPGASQLMFQYLQFPGEQDNAVSRVQIIGDGYLVGELSLNPFWMVSCRRSDQGNTLAFFSRTETESQAHSGFYWLNLSKPGEVYFTMPDLQVTELAFRPDGKKIAVIARHLNSSNSGLFLLDQATGENELLLSFEQAAFIRWKPDGQYLSLFGAETEGQQAAWMTVHVDSGLIAYRSAANPGDELRYGSNLYPNLIIPPADFPAWLWGINLQNSQDGLELCAVPGH